MTTQLFDWDDVEQFTGFASSDFKDTGVFMNATQWTAFGTVVVNSVHQAMHRFCNVTDFGTHTVTEYHNGRGASGDDSEYIESDRTFYLREFSTSVDAVYENENYGSSYPSWATRTPQDEDTFGDYVWWNDMDLIRVRFHQNIPYAGIRNVKIVYTGGYAPNSPELDELKTIGLRAAQNVLLHKKKVGESQTIRAMGTKDYSQMFSMVDEREVLTGDITRDLCKYRRWDFGGDHMR